MTYLRAKSWPNQKGFALPILSLLFLFNLKSSPALAGFVIDQYDQSIRGRLWPQGVIPYEIGPGFTVDGIANIKKAMSFYNERTVITFIPRTSQEHYILYSPWQSRAGGSSIGMQLGPQEIKLHYGVWEGTVAHELGHVVGLYHEHSRPDINVYYKYQYREGYEYCQNMFDYINEQGITIGKYDYRSIMNYYNGCIISATPTLVRTQPELTLWQYNRNYSRPDNSGYQMGTTLSPKDIQTIALLYKQSSAYSDWSHNCDDHEAYPGHCQYFTQENRCTSYSFQESAYRTCASSCGLCKSAELPKDPEPPEEDPGQECANQRQRSFCNLGSTMDLCRNQDFSWLCQQSCGICDERSPDHVMRADNGRLDDPWCGGWVRNESCQTNPRVRELCPASCQTWNRYLNEWRDWLSQDR